LFHANAKGKMNPTLRGELTWFCLRTQPKHEHIAAAHLREMEEVKVFLPRIRFKRATKRGTAWVTEALFPGYLFAQFDWQTSLRRVQHAKGCQGVVHFGAQWPVIHDKTIDELRQVVGAAELITISPELSPGDTVQIAEGSLRGLRAVVSRVMPARDRAAVLMDLLGQQAMIELKTSSIVKDGNKRRVIFRNASVNQAKAVDGRQGIKIAG
jgi:transcriptional antiterminator RfaH